MNVRYCFLLMAGLVLASVSLLAAAPSIPGSPDQEATKKTVMDTRAVGTAMWHWYKSEVAPKRSEEAHKKAQEQNPTKADFTAVPVISREDLAKILVPRYIAAIPEADGWGHPYEFRLNTQDPNAIQVMAVRSPGKDGKFAGDAYEVGEFASTDFDQDITWLDGYFVRWPQPK
ncbi:MAG TPA: hypothetical protein VGH73_22470 [Thermoanaerobaculia bacterium]|jgi:hypothetical protein